MVYTLPFCIVGYVIVALLFHKSVKDQLNWIRGIAVFVLGWVLATIPGWVHGGTEAYEGILMIFWPVLSYSVLFFAMRHFFKKVGKKEKSN